MMEKILIDKAVRDRAVGDIFSAINKIMKPIWGKAARREGQPLSELGAMVQALATVLSHMMVNLILSIELKDQCDTVCATPQGLKRFSHLHKRVANDLRKMLADVFRDELGKHDIPNGFLRSSDKRGKRKTVPRIR